MRTLDSHLHLWDPEVLTYSWLEGPLAARFAAEEIEGTRIDGATEERAIFVQAGTAVDDELDEVRWVAGQAERLGVVGIVAGARLDRGTDTTVHLESLTAEPLVVGVRHILQDEPDAVALSSAFVTGAREVAAHGWAFDACVRSWQLPDVARLSAAIPELRMVLDHLGKPAVGTAHAPLAPTAEWERDLAELARHPQVYCKVSGLPAEAGGDWSLAQLEPFLDTAADVFGPERLMWGTDWPVSAVGPARTDAASDAPSTYQPTARSRWANAVSTWADSHGIDRAALFHDTAAAFYRL